VVNDLEKPFGERERERDERERERAQHTPPIVLVLSFPH